MSFEIGEKRFLFLVGILAVVSAVGIVTGYGGTDPDVVGHTLGELEPGTFGAGDYVFPNNLDVGGSLDISGNMDVSGSLGVGGNLAITGDASAASYHITCPSGFTSVESQGRQLGCMQTAEANGGSALDWEPASDYCFDNYGGRLPSSEEWYIAMANYDLTDETDNWEWNSDHTYSGNRHTISGDGSIKTQTVSDDNNDRVFRCWIPA